MSTRVRGTMGGSSKKESERRDSLLGLRTYETLGLFRPIKKRKKAQKWSALDLSAIPDDVSEASNDYGSAPMSPDLSPFFNSTPLRAFGATDTTTLPFPHFDPNIETSQSNIHTGIDNKVLAEVSQLPQAAEAEPLSTHNPVETSSSENRKTVDVSSKQNQITFEAPSSYSNFNSDFTFRSAPLDTSPTKFKDSLETKKNFENVMAQIHQYTSVPLPVLSQENHPGQDAFDSITWDPDLPPGWSSADKSPERLALKPKPVVAYTTVGSVVNPNNVPQFSAPNRIQREGAGRRPLMSMTNRQYENLFQNHGKPPSPLGMQSPMQSSMQYTQHLQLIPPTYEELRPRSTAPTNQLPPTTSQLTDQEKQVLAKLDEAILKIPLNARKTVSATSSVSGSTPAFRPRILLNDEDVKRAYGVQGQRQGLEKMQTLQRLARFENPMREHALSRLSEFSVSAQAVTKANAVPGALETILRGHSTEGTNRGELNTSFQFPPPGLTSTVNPLYGAYSSSTYNSAPPSRPSGYPQPLTAGPPGQRQANQPFFNARNSAMNAAEAGNATLSRQPSGFTSYGTPDFQATVGSSSVTPEMYTAMPAEVYPPSRFARDWRPNNDSFRQIPWPYTTQQQQLKETGPIIVPSVEPLSLGPHTLLIDTIPNEMMAKYYPNGPPEGLGYYRAPAAKVEMSFRAVENELLPDHDGRGYSKEKRKIELDEFFFAGQKRYFMTGEDHIIELEHREANAGTAPLPKPQIPPPLTPEEVEKMAIAKAVKPLIDGSFGTLLAFAETSDRSRTKWSGWSTAKPELIDDSVEGNKSCFGEDWGNTKLS